MRLPKFFGWEELSFGDRLKMLALVFQAGAGIAMTMFSGYAMFKLAQLRAVWPLFYLAMGALLLVGVVLTGFAGLLIRRTLEINGPGGFVFKSQDATDAAAVVGAMPSPPTGETK